MRPSVVTVSVRRCSGVAADSAPGGLAADLEAPREGQEGLDVVRVGVVHVPWWTRGGHALAHSVATANSRSEGKQRGGKRGADGPFLRNTMSTAGQPDRAWNTVASVSLLMRPEEKTSWGRKSAHRRVDTPTRRIAPAPPPKRGRESGRGRGPHVPRGGAQRVGPALREGPDEPPRVARRADQQRFPADAHGLEVDDGAEGPVGEEGMGGHRRVGALGGRGEAGSGKA